jgi:hypothetical protein
MNARCTPSGVFAAQSHEVSVYDAIEWPVKARETLGLGSDTLVRMLDRGRRLDELLELIEADFFVHADRVALSTGF